MSNMKTPALSNFTTLQIQSDIKKGKSNPLAMQIAKKLDSTNQNKYSSEDWKYTPPSNHYRNTFVEQQQQTFLKKLNLV
ncbi:MAG: hypothetical protein BM556_12305 [Bacteriovorax sp. MedPE-SWde]|nr:MAG: hypothetical protein BM556_12305 [Bacteriovorax sp. MedPE-SWde]